MELTVDAILAALWGFLMTWGPRVIGVLFALFVAWVFAGWVQRTIVRRLSKRLDVSLVKFFASLARYGIIIGAVVGCLGVFGIQTASFAAVIAAGGLAIGLAFQGTLSNFAAGIMLLVFRPFKVGDVVRIDSNVGSVEEIELFTTAMNTPDNRRIIIPNSKVFGNTIENLTAQDRRRVDVAVGVEYSADIDEVRAVLEKVAAGIPNALEEPPPQVFLEALGGSSVDWQVRIWATPDEYWDVYQATIRGVKLALDEAGIGIPFPQQDVHLDTELIAALRR